MFGVPDVIWIPTVAAISVSGIASAFQASASEGKTISWLTRIGIFLTSKSKSPESFKNKIFRQLENHRLRKDGLKKRNARLEKAQIKLRPILEKLNKEDEDYTFFFESIGLKRVSREKDWEAESFTKAFNQIGKRELKEIESNQDDQTSQDKNEINRKIDSLEAELEKLRKVQVLAGHEPEVVR